MVVFTATMLTIWLEVDEVMESAEPQLNPYLPGGGEVQRTVLFHNGGMRFRTYSNDDQGAIDSRCRCRLACRNIKKMLSIPGAAMSPVEER